MYLQQSVEQQRQVSEAVSETFPEQSEGAAASGQSNASGSLSVSVVEGTDVCVIPPPEWWPTTGKDKGPTGWEYSDATLEITRI